MALLAILTGYIYLYTFCPGWPQVAIPSSSLYPNPAGEDL